MRNMVWRLLQPKRLERLLEAAKTLRMEWAFWRRGLNKCLLLYFLPRPSSLPPPAFQTPLVPPRAQSPFLTLGCVGGLSGILLLCFRTSFILSSSFFSRSPLRTRRGRAAVGRVRAATPISSLPPPLRGGGGGWGMVFSFSSFFPVLLLSLLLLSKRRSCPRAQSPFLTLGWVGSWFGRQRGKTFF